MIPGFTYALPQTIGTQLKELSFGGAIQDQP